jgi:antitoxin HicB
MNKARIGSTLDSFLVEEGIKESVDLLVQKARLVDTIEKAMSRRKMTQTDLAEAMQTSRAVVHRLLDRRDARVTLETLGKAAKALGLRVDQLIRLA